MSKMLLVEDNQLSQKMMFYTLRHVGLKADVADDGRKAVEMATSNNYDIILMDIMMPELNGYEATHFIRKFEQENKSKKAFIIGLTGNVYDSERQKCINAGMDEFIAKPFDIDNFLNIVRNYKLMDV